MPKLTRPRIVAKQRLADVAMPEQVMLSLVDLTRSAKEHFLSLSVAAGLLVLKELLAADLTRLVGPKGKHRPGRTAYRHGSETGSITLGGRRVEIERPRARTTDGGELHLPTYAAVADRDPLGEAALARMLLGISSRHYVAALEPVGDDVPRAAPAARGASSPRPKPSSTSCARATSATSASSPCSSTASRSPTTPSSWPWGSTSGPKSTSWGWPRAPPRTPPSARRSSPSSPRAACPPTARCSFVIDGGKAIRTAIRDTYGALAPVQRCVLHKGWNVMDRLPEGLRPVIRRKLDQAWRMEDADEAERALRRLADSLEETHPGAAGSIREGLEETLTVSRMGLSPALIKTFKSTNPIESLNDGVRVMERNVKNWQSGTMALRWTAAAALEREKRFRRINGHRNLWILRRALDRHTKEVTSSRTAA